MFDGKYLFSHCNQHNGIKKTKAGCCMKHAECVWMSYGQNREPFLMPKLAVLTAAIVSWKVKEISVKTWCNHVAGRREKL